MNLSSALAQRINLAVPALPAPRQLNAAIERIHARWPDVVSNPPEKDRERLVQEVRTRLDGDGWEGTPLSLVTRAARALFESERSARTDLTALRDFYYDEVRASTRSAFLAAMLAVHVASYQPGAEHTHALGDALMSNTDRLGARGRNLLRHVPELLHPHDAPGAVARLMAGMVDPWTGLKAIGFRSPHAPGLMQHAHDAFVRQIAPSLKQRTGLEHLFGWVRPPGREPLRAGAATVIETVLSPWLSTNPQPDDITFITHSLIGLYGDPRIHGGGAWTGIAPSVKGVILRWLAGENIRFFLDVVSAVEDSHMWEPRRRFWLKLHEEGRIDGAWVAFSRSGDEYARRASRSSGAAGTLRYGLQVAKGSRTNTSLLILQVGSKIVVEGSHSYRVHIFDQTIRSRPALYEGRYDADDIADMLNAWSTTHQGYWQGRVLEQV